jgi:hypothetical protein
VFHIFVGVCLTERGITSSGCRSTKRDVAGEAAGEVAGACAGDDCGQRGCR